MKQKFKQYSFVHVCKEMPSWMEHFPSDFDAIVMGTYSQLYGGTNVKSYCLYPLNNGKIYNQIAWYEESQLTQIENVDNLDAEELAEEYRFKNGH